MELHEIIDRTFEGDVHAFSELASRYRDMAFGYALTLVDREQTAEDAVQESLIVAFSNLKSLRQPEAFGAWLRGIVRHQCFRALRAAPATVSWDSLVTSDALEPTPNQSKVWDQVRSAIEDLPSAQKQLVVMHYELGLSQQEISESLGLTVATVNMRLHSARTRLKRRLTTMPESNQSPLNPGRIQDVNGPIVIVQFAPPNTPPISSILSGYGNHALVVLQHLGAGRILAMASQSGSIWTPGQEVSDLGEPCTTPLEIENVTKLIDSYRSSIHGELLASGIKTIDVFAPMTKSGTTGIFTEWGLGVLVLLPELIHHLDKESNRQTIFVFTPPLADEKQWKEVTAEITLGSRNISIVYVPVTDPINQVFIDSFTGLDSKLVLSRSLSEQAIWPCIDPLASSSKLLNDASGDKALCESVKNLLRNYYALQFSTDPAKRHTLSGDELLQVQRARKALRYLSQPFFVAEPYTKQPGISVVPEDARQGFADILSGKFDAVNRDAFYMTGARPK